MAYHVYSKYLFHTVIYSSPQFPLIKSIWEPDMKADYIQSICRRTKRGLFWGIYTNIYMDNT